MHLPCRNWSKTHQSHSHEGYQGRRQMTDRFPMICGDLSTQTTTTTCQTDTFRRGPEHKSDGSTGAETKTEDGRVFLACRRCRRFPTHQLVKAENKRQNRIVFPVKEPQQLLQKHKFLERPGKVLEGECLVLYPAHDPSTPTPPTSLPLSLTHTHELLCFCTAPLISVSMAPPGGRTSVTSEL